MDIIILIIIGIISRLAPHLPNATAVGSLALFGGARLGTKKTLVALLATMLVTDLFLGLHPVMWATYASFIISIFIGRVLVGKHQAGAIAAATLAGSGVFFLLTNFAVWLVPGSMYPKTWSGLVQCYVLAIPFLRNSVLGDMLYTLVFFGGYALAKATRIKFGFVRD